MLAVCNGRTYAYPQKNPVSGGSLIYSQLLSCSSKETKHRTTLSLCSRRGGPRQATQFTLEIEEKTVRNRAIDDSRCRDMPVVCSDLTYVRTGTMLKVTGIWAMVATV